MLQNKLYFTLMLKFKIFDEIIKLSNKGKYIMVTVF